MSWLSRAPIAVAVLAAFLTPAAADAVEPPEPHGGALFAEVQTPSADAVLAPGTPLVIAGRASGTGEGNSVDTVEVSVDGGTNWQAATLGAGLNGSNRWSSVFTPDQPGELTVVARAAFQDTRQQIPPTPVHVTVGDAPTGPPAAVACPCELDLPEIPGSLLAADPDLNPVELGVRFQPDRDGVITGLVAERPPGPAVEGHLWGPDGTLLGAATGTAQLGATRTVVTFATPVPVQAGLTYTASYFTAGSQYYSAELYFGGTLLDPPLRTVFDETGGAGVYAYSDDPAFPTNTWNRSNYWVHPVFDD